MRSIAILGSTGSIGTQALSVIDEQQDIDVCALSCGKNISLLCRQIEKYRPRLVSVSDEKTAESLSEMIGDSQVEICYGIEGMIRAATLPEADIVLTAVVGMRGIEPTIAAINAGKDIALANKETLVCAGDIIMPLAREKGIQILPVDSEHSAIFQSLQGNKGNTVSRILLTCSGGPFRGMKRDELNDITPQRALKHPNWSMGAKISIDSATLINKGLEVIEAASLFGVDASQIEVVVHPQSIIHSAVEYEDGSVIAQMGLADMRIPIEYALYYPHRIRLSGERLDLFKIKSLTFERPDTGTFFGLKLAYEACQSGGNLKTVYNAANEYAVELFLNNRISFLAISDMVKAAMEHIPFIKNPTVDDILHTEAMTYDWIKGSYL